MTQRADAQVGSSVPPPLADPVFPRPGLLFDAGLWVLVLVLVTISPLALVTWGFNYDEAGGTVLEKIHPGTWLAAGLLLAAMAAEGNPLTWLIDRFSRSPALIVFALGIAILMAHTIQVVKLPFTPLIDTFIAPLLIFLLLVDLPEDRGRRLALLLHVVMLANAVVGIVEFASGLRLTPLVAAGVVIEDDWRSTALLGHPLANASLTGCYMLMLALGATRDLPRLLAPVALGLSGAGMVVFGGRAATVLLLAILAALALRRLAAIAAGARFDPRSVLTALIVVPVAGIALVVLAEAGFFDQFVERFIDDKGSADARYEMFELFRHISWHDLVLGPDARHMETLRALYGLDFGIESFWIAYLLTNGIVVSVVFFVSLMVFCREIVRSVSRGGLWVLGFFFLVASTSVSLSAKSPLLAVLTLMMLILMRRPPSAATAPDA